jgi:dihydrofolate reductase
MINIIVAMTTSGVIGREGALPWYIPEDLKLFKRITSKHPVIMGRTTFESLNMPFGLPKRKNYIVTRNRELIKSNGVAVISHESKESYTRVGDYPEYMSSLEAAIAEAGIYEKDIFIIGGASIYKQALEKDLVDNMYISFVKDEYEGDTYFPDVDWSKWESNEMQCFNEFTFKKMSKIR